MWRVELANTGLQYYHWRYPQDRARLERATALLAAIPSQGYLVETLCHPELRWAFGDLPEDTAGWYEWEPNRITYDVTLRELDIHDLAVVMAHEARHAYDDRTSGPPATPQACFAYERRAYTVEAEVWEAWYGPRGKPRPANEFEMHRNWLLHSLKHDRPAFEAWLAVKYAEQCRVRATGSTRGVR